VGGLCEEVDRCTNFPYPPRSGISLESLDLEVDELKVDEELEKFEELQELEELEEETLLDTVEEEADQDEDELEREDKPVAAAFSFPSRNNLSAASLTTAGSRCDVRPNGDL
jgi:hypothetical protein